MTKARVKIAPIDAPIKAEGLVALVDVVAHVMEKDATKVRIIDGLRKRINECLDLSTEIAAIIGSTQAEVLAGVLKILANTSQSNPEELLKSFLVKYKELQKKIKKLEAGTDLIEAQVVLEEERRKVKDLEGKLEELKATIALLQKSLIEKDTLLQQAKNQAKFAEIAASDIVKLREVLLTDLTAVAAKIESTVQQVRTQEGGVLAAYFQFREIHEAADRCLVIFQQLKPDVLKNIQLFGIALAQYEEISKEISANKEIPSLHLLERVLKCLGCFEALKILQDQLIADQVGETLNVPSDWLDETGQLINFYEVIGAQPDDSNEKLKKAYRKKTTSIHPDKASSDEERALKEKLIKLVHKAWEILNNEEQKIQYDAVYKKVYS